MECLGVLHFPDESCLSHQKAAHQLQTVFVSRIHRAINQHSIDDLERNRRAIWNGDLFGQCFDSFTAYNIQMRSL